MPFLRLVLYPHNTATSRNRRISPECKFILLLGTESFCLWVLPENLRRIQCGQSWVENLAESEILGRKQKSWNRIAFESQGYCILHASGSWGHLGREAVTWISWKYILGVLWTDLQQSWAKTVWFRPCDSNGHQGPVPRDVPWQNFKWLGKVWVAKLPRLAYVQGISQVRKTFVGK